MDLTSVLGSHFLFDHCVLQQMATRQETKCKELYQKIGETFQFCECLYETDVVWLEATWTLVAPLSNSISGTTQHFTTKNLADKALGSAAADSDFWV